MGAHGPSALRGRWVAAASRRLFAPESFALLVEPAIADLQAENSGRLSERLDAYRTVWIGMAAACDDGIARRTRAVVRENELVTLTGLALLHAAHSAWMIVLLLGIDGRVHLGRMLANGFAELPTPGLLAATSVVALYAGRALIVRLMSKSSSSPTPSIVRGVE
jgi:hypothetical protein